MSAEAESAAEQGSSLWKDAWARLRRNRLATFCLGVLVAITLLCLFGPFFSPYKSNVQDLDYGAQGPSASHWMGTDEKGRDMATRVLVGGRISLAVGAVATFVALLIGVSYGAISGYAGGRTDAFMMRVVDILYAIPFLLFVILLTVLFGRSLLILFAAIGAVEWLTMARMVRAQTASLRKQEFVEAAVSLGLGWPRIIFRHLLPNVLGVIIVYATLTVPSIMLLEATLSFLGLGVQPPNSSWGDLIKQGATVMDSEPWRLFFPALFFSLTLFSLNFVGDGLRDALDPRAAKD